jgi:hypothetical protein
VQNFGCGRFDRSQIVPSQPLEGEVAVDNHLQRIAVIAKLDPVTEPEAKTIATDPLLKDFHDFSDDDHVVGFLVQRGHTGSRNLPLGNCAAAKKSDGI